jgi:curved DNA-binding protein CbpA
VKTYYDLLEVPRSASADEIKRAFRREIAKYHPDKVQHLGEEFQEIAVVKAAELTQAYQTLSDPAARADYDAQLDDHPGGAPHYGAPHQGSPAHHPTRSQTDPASARPANLAQEAARDAQPSGGASPFEQERAGAVDLIRKATYARFRQALEREFGRYEEAPLRGFDVVCIPKPPFWSLRLPPRILGRFLPEVDGAAVLETWALAVRMKKDPQRDLCVFVMAPAVAPPGELAAAIAEQRRKRMPAGGKLIMIPVNTRTWNAHVPTDAPPVVKSLLTRLKAS